MGNCSALITDVEANQGIWREGRGKVVVFTAVQQHPAELHLQEDALKWELTYRAQFLSLPVVRVSRARFRRAEFPKQEQVIMDLPVCGNSTILMCPTCF